MKKSLRKKLDVRKRRTAQRIEKSNWNGQSPMIDPPAIRYELAEKTQAIAAGGLGVAQQMVRQLDVARSINHGCPIFKFHLPYSEADHVLNIAFNLLAGGTCLEHLELRRNDEAYLDALGAQRIPDPTTAGDFCRRFSEGRIQDLMDALHEPRLKVWRQQPEGFFDLAIIEGDGTMVETCGEKKEGIGMNHKRQWGYHPLIITLANNGSAREKRRAQKRQLLGMDFSTFRQTMIQIPAQILTSGRQLIYRFLTWTPSLETVFHLHESVNQPLRI